MNFTLNKQGAKTICVSSESILGSPSPIGWRQNTV